MKYLAIFFFTFNSILFSQDIIIRTDGELIDSRIIEIGIDDIKYRKYENLEGPIYVITKDKVFRIEFENGGNETFVQSNSSEEKSLQETKNLIVEYINKYGFEENNFNRAYRASFEGDYLRLIVMNKEGTEKVNNGILYDFSIVYQFDDVSKRSDQLAFVNIWVSILKNKRKNTWDKHKLIMRVGGHKNAELILNALKHYNQLLLKRNN